MVDHQVNLQESWWRRIPIGEGSYRNIAARRLLPPASEPAARRCPDRLEQPVQGGGAGGQQPLTHPRVQIQVAIAPWTPPDGVMPPSAACRSSGSIPVGGRIVR